MIIPDTSYRAILRKRIVRLMPPLPQALAEMAPQLVRLVAPVVEQVAQRLSQGYGTATKPLTVPTLLTQANRSAGRDRVRMSARREMAPVKLDAPSACRECGVILEEPTRHYCEECLQEYRETQSISFSDSGRAKLKALRAAGIDPSQTGDAAEKRRMIMKQRRQEELAWDAAHPEVRADEAVFAREILPGLQGLPLSRISSATGLSQQYCSLIRRGLKVPHRRHWSHLSRLIQPSDGSDQPRRQP